MRVEWAKSKAHAERWGEETQLLTEEMRRVVEYFAWKARWWAIQGQRRTHASTEIQEGIVAYAAKQVAMYHGLAKSFIAIWHPSLQTHGKQIQWPIEYMPAVIMQMTTDMGMDVDDT